MYKEKLEEESKCKFGSQVAELDASTMSYGEGKKITNNDLNILILKKSLNNERFFM